MSFLFQAFLVLATQLLLTSGLSLVPRTNNGTGFVYVEDGNFHLNGNFYRFYGTNAYWAHMTTDADLDLTFGDIAKAGFQVVRTWAFNDVTSQPSSGTYFQVLSNGQQSINEGANGLQRLDKLVEAAGRHGIKLVLTLTNNWNPERPQPSTSWIRRSNDDLPRGYLSNDYGGIDAYVRNFAPGGTHDLFYTDSTIINAFKNYIDKVVPRYANNPTILGWELGNDLRCSSTVSASSNCNTKTITSWVADISAFVKKLAPNHLVTAGDGGFYCLTCNKLFAKKSTKPRPELVGPSFDGSFGIDHEDILSISTIDFGSLQVFPDFTELFPPAQERFAVKAIGDGGKWIEVHAQTSDLICKPEALLAAGIVTNTNWPYYVPINESKRGTAPPRSDGGVEEWERAYALTFWASASLNTNVDGMLEYQWLQTGLSSGSSPIAKRQAPAPGSSPQDGHGNYNGAASGMNSEQFRASLPPIEQE